MGNTVPILSMIFMAIDLAAGVAVPAVLVIGLRKKFHCSMKPFLAGCLIMFMFSVILEQIVHSIILGSSIGSTIKNNIWLYGIYGGLMAGLFEETGRLFAFKTILRKEQSDDHNALMYGAGHGGFEMFYILTMSMINNLIYSVMINTGSMDKITSTLSGNQLEQMNTALSQLTTASPGLFLVSLLERLAALPAQMGLSVLVWFAVKKTGKAKLLYPLAILLHMLIDAVAVILNNYISQILFVELAICLVSVLIVFTAVTVWKKAADTDRATA